MSSHVIALVPARKHSKGIPSKNFRLLAGVSPVKRAVDCAIAAGLAPVVTSDAILYGGARIENNGEPIDAAAIPRPPELATDSTPMIEVIRHALDCLGPGNPDDLFCLIQPTQPLRKPSHLTAAIELLRTSGADSVVSVVELCPLDWVLYIDVPVGLEPLAEGSTWANRRPMRQGAQMAYRMDGTAIAFYRKTVTEHGSIYGEHVAPLIIPPDETCPLDTLDDWHDAERRLREMS